MSGARSGRGSAWPILALMIVFATPPAAAQCPEQPPLLNHTGVGRVTCPCFVAGEEAGATFLAPAAHYPLEILRVGIGWGSQFGGAPSSLESAIHIYQGGLPDPGTPIFSLDGPVLNDGAINQFNLEPIPGNIMIPSGPFSVTLEFFNENAGNPFAPSVVHDNNGCQPGRNLVYAIPGGWSDACALGVQGDWVFFVVYRPCGPPMGVDELVWSSRLSPPRPNPARASVELEFELAQAGTAVLSIRDVAGRLVTRLVDDPLAAGVHHVRWDGRDRDGAPAPSGAYFVELRGTGRTTRRVVLLTR